ncbi:putative cytoplasmic protein [Salmonella enterica subsp. enterica serovar Dublin]|nr:putative cytoplasmic protein [Salmonella enterica subsp. enterica serovar Dublin]
MRVSEQVLLSSLRQGGCVRSFWRRSARLAGTPSPIVPDGLVLETPGERGIPHSVMWILRWYRSGWSARKPGHRPSGERSSAGRSGDCVLTGRTPPHDTVTHLSGY